MSYTLILLSMKKDPAEIARDAEVKKKKVLISGHARWARGLLGNISSGVF